MKTPKDIAWSFWELASEGKVDEAVDLLDDNGTYWACMRGGRHTRTMASMKAFFSQGFRRVPMTFTFRDALSEGNRVALEFESWAETANGTYNNVYCFIMTVEGGKITHIREYVDTLHAMEVLIPLVSDILE